MISQTCPPLGFGSDPWLIPVGPKLVKSENVQEMNIVLYCIVLYIFILNQEQIYNVDSPYVVPRLPTLNLQCSV
jgi:hypothetical protein